MDQKKNRTDFSSVNTFPPKQTITDPEEVGPPGVRGLKKKKNLLTGQ
jgi:hypothetical protein